MLSGGILTESHALEQIEKSVSERTDTDFLESLNFDLSRRNVSHKSQFKYKKQYHNRKTKTKKPS